MSKITELNYKQLIFRIQRPTHDEHSQALCEAERRIAKGCKRAATQEALVAAVNAARLGAPVPHARTTRRRNERTRAAARTRSVPAVRSTTPDPLPEGAFWNEYDMLVFA